MWCSQCPQKLVCVLANKKFNTQDDKWIRIYKYNFNCVVSTYRVQYKYTDNNIKIFLRNQFTTQGRVSLFLSYVYLKFTGSNVMRVSINKELIRFQSCFGLYPGFAWFLISNVCWGNTIVSRATCCPLPLG